MAEPVLKIYDCFHDVYHHEYMGSKYDQYNLIWGLIGHIEDKTGRLVIDGRDMNCSDIAKVMNKKKDKIATIVTDMIANGVMMGFDGAFFLNPQYIQADHISDEEYIKLQGEGIE